MSRVGTNLDKSSDLLEARMLPNVEQAKAGDGGGEIDLAGDGVHKIYMHRGQLEVYNFGARNTKIRGARGFGKTSYIGVHMMKCVLGMPRQMGGFVGASAKQLYTRTMPNALKVVEQLGFGKFFFLGQPPAKLHWDMPLARPRVWENCVSFSNGYVWQMLSMAVNVLGSANGLNLAALVGDETKYLPWKRVKEEVLPTLRGDFIPASARKTEVKKWGFGTNSKINPYYCSQLWVSDAGLTQRQCEWEKEKDFETKDINRQIAQMLAELKYLEKHSPKMAVKLAQNDNYLRKLNELRSQAEVFWQFSSIDNISLLGGEEWLRSMKRELPDLMFRLQILGQLPGKASDGFYCQFSEELNTYVSADCTDYILDKFSKKEKGRYLDAQRYPTDVEYLTLDMKELELAGENCSCDQDLDYGEPLRIAIDAGHEMNCMVVGQAVNYHGKPSVLVMKEFFVKGSTRLRGLVRMFTEYYKPFLRRNGEVIYYYNQTSKQGGATAYAVEDSESMRFDNVVTQELESYGWKVTRGEFSVWRHERKWQLFCDVFSFLASPSVYINSENGRCPYLLCAITSAGILNGFKKDKSREKYKSEDGVGGDPRTRTDITDAFDDLIIGIKEGAEGNKKVGGRLRHKFKNLIVPR